MPTSLFRWMFVWIIRIIEYDRIDISQGINVDMSNKSKDCVLCHYWYFSNKNFSYGPYLCDGCYDISQKSADFKNIVHVKKLLFTLKNVYIKFIFCIWVSVKQKN